MKLPPLWGAGTVPRSNALLEDLTYRDLCQTRCPDSRIPIGNVDKLVSVAGLGEKRRFSRRRLLCGQGQVGAAHQMDRLADVAPALRSASPALVRECWRTESLHRNSSRVYREVENPSIKRPRPSLAPCAFPPLRHPPSGRQCPVGTRRYWREVTPIERAL